MTAREKTNVTVRLEPEEYEALAIVAQKERRSLSNQILAMMSRMDEWQKELERLRSAQSVAQQVN